ncbi:FAD:protein FMN transferase [Paucibacter sp. DJ2R-2]|uniref:FAD:protein FMN transferase n=1 Tax=Paucibacter sp. DJ2R-2 TaxID=2893558 RepID=UPI0021E3BC13|nr:FAD:protein FMN transferase [Paucibacter sp. DJ2R-2]MCV2422235.1 FAD:protein FMN transferase [Paucibacter sp. DJ4R-1]MCV2440181.1 FAD:protein FMN transferase [Paucibacter sp. DJ2R-2]
MKRPALTGAALSRRSALAWALPLLASAAALPQPARAMAAQRRDSRPLLGTRVDMVAEGGSAAFLAEAMDSAFGEMARLSAMMSRYEPESALSRINQAAGRSAVAVPSELMAVLQTGLALHRRTEGWFDMTVGALKSWRFEAGQHGAVPNEGILAHERSLVDAAGLRLDPAAGRAHLLRPGMALDLGGVAKLPILAAGMRRLQDWGVANALINGGGDVLYRGRNQGRPWRVGLRDPRRPQQLIGVLDLQGQGVLAASGDYERYFIADGQRQHHILSPRSGRPSQGACGVSLWARDVDLVNGLGAAFMLGGHGYSRDYLGRTPELQALLVYPDQTVWATSDMQRALRPWV